VRTATDDVCLKAYVRLLGSLDVGPAYAYERNFDAPSPRCTVCAFALPTQVEESTRGRAVDECTAKSERPWIAAFFDIYGTIEAQDACRGPRSEVDVAFRVL
jgi:hypothetical protein